MITQEMIKDFKSGETVLVDDNEYERVFIGESIVKDTIIAENLEWGIARWHVNSLKNWTVKKEIKKIVVHTMPGGHIYLSLEGSNICKSRDDNDTERIGVDLSKMEVINQGAEK